MRYIRRIYTFGEAGAPAAVDYAISQVRKGAILKGVYLDADRDSVAAATCLAEVKVSGFQLCQPMPWIGEPFDAASAAGRWPWHAYIGENDLLTISFTVTGGADVFGYVVVDEPDRRFGGE